MVDLGASISKGLPAGEMLVDQRARDRRRPSPHNSALLIRGRTEAGNRQSIFRVVDHEVIDHVIDDNQRAFIGRFDQRPSHSHQRENQPRQNCLARYPDPLPGGTTAIQGCLTEHFQSFRNALNYVAFDPLPVHHQVLSHRRLRRWEILLSFGCVAITLSQDHE